MSDTIQCVVWSIERSKNGHIRVPWDDETLDELLWKSIRATNCELEFRNFFLATNPQWYGLWIQSPLSAEQCAILGKVLADLAGALPRHNHEYGEFAAVLQEAARQRAPVMVEMTPPGHVDFGWYTVFAHCPRCKAEAPVDRWKSPYPDVPIDCAVCGFGYSPAATHSSEREFWSTVVKCERCERRFAVREFSEAGRDLLEEQASVNSMVKELQWLNRVGDFYKRHPDKKDKIRPDVIRVRESDDPQIRKQRSAGVPYDEIFFPDDAVQDDRLWSEEDLAVIDYLKHNSFEFDGRYAFVQARVQAGADTVLNQQVSCPDCGGRIG